MIFSEEKLTTNSTPFSSIGWRHAVRSFHICNRNIGGHKLKMDITKHYDYTNPTIVPKVFERYRNVCTCINVPQYVQNMEEWEINNYGNAFLAYYQPNCSENKWKAENIPAGCWRYQLGDKYRYKYDSVTKTSSKFQSIGPNPNSKYFKTSCSHVVVKNQTENLVPVNMENKLVSCADLKNLQQNFSSLATKTEQHYKQTETLLTEIQDLKNKTVELESKQENHFRCLKDSIAKLKEDFNNFVIKLDHKLSKLVGD